MVRTVRSGICALLFSIAVNLNGDLEIGLTLFSSPDQGVPLHCQPGAHLLGRLVGGSSFPWSSVLSSLRTEGPLLSQNRSFSVRQKSSDSKGLPTGSLFYLQL